VGQGRKNSAGLWVSDGQKAAAEVGTQDSSRRGRAARLRGLYFRYRSINTAMTKAIAMNFKPAVNIEIANPHLPSVYTIKPMTVADKK